MVRSTIFGLLVPEQCWQLVKSLFCVSVALVTDTHQHLTVHHFLTRETQRHYLPICLLLRPVRRRKHTNMRMMFLGTRQSLEVDVMKVGVDFEWEWQMCVIQLFSASIGYFGQCFLHPVQPPYYQRGFLWQLTVLITK